MRTTPGPEPALPGVAFPGPNPGKARATAQGGGFTLSNRALSVTWTVRGRRLLRATLVDRVHGKTLSQSGTELFRLATRPPKPIDRTHRLALRLDPDRVVVLANDTELASFPRDRFPGPPRLARIGKMDLKARARDHAGDLGPVGVGRIAEIRPAPAPPTPDTFAFQTEAHRAATAEFPFPADARTLSARIDKGTDAGMSWGPAIALVWDEGTRFVLVGVREARGVFNVTTADAERIVDAPPGATPEFDLPASGFLLTGSPRVVPIRAVRGTARAADRIPGMAVEATFEAPNGVVARWRAELRDGSHYVRQTLTLTSPKRSQALHGVELADLRLSAPRTVGTVPGCPVAGDGLFLGVEMPGARNRLDSDRARIAFVCALTLAPGRSYDFGAVVGVAPPGQLRRAFVAYVERERARQSRPFLHANGWYDLGYDLNADKIVDVVAAFDRELVRKRGVAVRAYLVDDGWDDPNRGLWEENPDRFPGGFAALKRRMARFGARLGIWISPLGGYGGDKERTEHARRMGLIPKDSGLDLAHERYRAWFEARCLRLMREGGVNAFKWDRAGDGVSPHFMALLAVARRLRRENPDVFLNVTVGTWPSPFWLHHVDTTWRNGSADVGWAGKGDDREQWLTFRDGSCHRLFVEASPLYPLNAVMHHGIVHGRAFQAVRVSRAGSDLKHEARSYFANGAQLQELYLTPSMMTDDAWDRIAEAAKWAHANADVLADAHWVGGDPLRLEPYGVAAWNRRKGTLMLRNPDDRPREIAVDIGDAFELPPGAPRRYALRSPYPDQRLRERTVRAGVPARFDLAPFEVLVFDAFPAA